LRLDGRQGLGALKEFFFEGRSPGWSVPHCGR
jgi:hypothetical protein